jgi:hypothetical protein
MFVDIRLSTVTMTANPAGNTSDRIGNSAGQALAFRFSDMGYTRENFGPFETRINPSKARFASKMPPLLSVHLGFFDSPKARRGLCIWAFLSAAVMTCGAQTIQTNMTTAPTGYTVVSRAANSEVLAQTTYRSLATGQSVSQAHYVTRIASGMNYWT